MIQVELEKGRDAPGIVAAAVGQPFGFIQPGLEKSLSWAVPSAASAANRATRMGCVRTCTTPDKPQRPRACPGPARNQPVNQAAHDLIHADAITRAGILLRCDFVQLAELATARRRLQA